MGKVQSGYAHWDETVAAYPEHAQAVAQAQATGKPVQYKLNDYLMTVNPDGTYTGEDKGHFWWKSLGIVAAVLGGGALAAAFMAPAAAGAAAGGGATVGGTAAAGGMTLGGATAAPLASSAIGTGMAASAPAAVTGATLGGAGATGALASTLGQSVGTVGGGSNAATSAAAGSGLTLSDWMTKLAPTALGAAASIYGVHAQTSASQKAADAQVAAAKYAADLQAKQAADSLAFLQQQEAERKAEWEKTQALNLDQYNQQQVRLAPYRTLGGVGASALQSGLSNGGNGSMYRLGG